MTAPLTEEQMRLVESFNQKVGEGALPTECVTCLCGSKHSVSVAGYDWYGLWSPVVICRSCGLVYANLRMTAEASREFYSSDEYRRIYESEGDFLLKAVTRFDGKYGRHIFEALHPEMAARGFSTVGEVGCAAGWNLVHFIERGYRAVGYD